MRLKYSVFFFFLVITGNSQSLQERLFPLICDCFEKQMLGETLEPSLMENCFDISSGQKLKEFEEYLEKEIDTIEVMKTYGEGQAYGRLLAATLFSDIQEPLVNGCEAYYSFLIAMHKYMMGNMSKGTSKIRVDSLRMEIESGKIDANIAWEVGAYYLGKEKLKEAKEYFSIATGIDSLHIPSNMFLGIVHDLEGDYQKAIEMYEKIETDEVHGLTFMAPMFKALSKRKLKEK